MSLTIEIYAADSQELVALFAEDPFSEDEDPIQSFFKSLETYPMVDLSLHLNIPEDMDSLCQALRKHQALIPSTFRDLLVEQLWVDQPERPSESLTLLADDFARALAAFADHEIEQAAIEWAGTFPPDETPPQETPEYQAVLHLREVARDAVARNISLILRLVG